jgi:hypothetical protein
MAGGDSHADALGRAEQLLRQAEAATDGGEAVRQAWAAVAVLKDARHRAPHEGAEQARNQRSPLYVRAVEAVKKSGQWAEARRLAAHLRFDRDARRADRTALGQVVRQANDQLQLAPPPDQCNLVLKGGITSGVIYPRALGALAERYTFRSIGGASVGAVAAAAAAAAEYSRQHFKTEAPTQGFEGLEKLPDELGETCSSRCWAGRRPRERRSGRRRRCSGPSRCRSSPRWRWPGCWSGRRRARTGRSCSRSRRWRRSGCSRWG